MQKALLLLILLLSLATVTADASESRKPDGLFRLGGGIGIPYGSLGVNLDFSPIQYFSLSAGFGLLGGVAVVGGKVYPLGREEPVRPRLSAFFGSILVEKSNISAFGIGGEWGPSRRHSLDFDIFFINENSKFSYPSVFPAIGYGFHF